MPILNSVEMSRLMREAAYLLGEEYNEEFEHRLLSVYCKSEGARNLRRWLAAGDIRREWETGKPNAILSSD